ncbi:melatonin receptor [Branchiostoma belcheri]|nr:melatonin receptor [Branchiostoma belcheri]
MSMLSLESSLSNTAVLRHGVCALGRQEAEQVRVGWPHSLAEPVCIAKLRDALTDTKSRVQFFRPRLRPLTVYYLTLVRLVLIKTLVIMCVSFFICWSPYAIVVLADFKDNWPQTVHILALIMAHASSSINCVIYGFTNDKFRRGLFHLVRKVRVQVDSENAQAANQPSHPPTAIEMFNINKPIAPDMIVVS